MNYWLLKSEPGEFGIGDLKRCTGGTEHWDGVRNYQARNFMRDEMRKGDLAFFYHSNCASPGIVGIIRVVREAYPDFTAFDPSSKHFDAGTNPSNPRWYMVDVQFLRELKRVITLAEMKAFPELDGMPLLQRGSRLSVMPVSEGHWRFILGLETH
jgi:predicted RNA-binding protein with PUA-like domain